MENFYKDLADLIVIKDTQSKINNIVLECKNELLKCEDDVDAHEIVSDVCNKCKGSQCENCVLSYIKKTINYTEGA